MILQLQDTSQPPPSLPPSCLPFLLVIKLLIDKLGSLLNCCLILIITRIINGWTKLHVIYNTEFWEYLPGDPTWVLSSLPLERLFQWMQEISASFYSLYLLKKKCIKMIRVWPLTCKSAQSSSHLWQWLIPLTSKEYIQPKNCHFFLSWINSTVQSSPENQPIPHKKTYLIKISLQLEKLLES